MCFSTDPGGKHAKPSMQGVPDSEDMIEGRPEAEDECIRDLRRALFPHFASVSVVRQCMTPDDLRNRRDLLEPYTGRASDLDQPGGFRRHYMQQHSAVNTYMLCPLPLILGPTLKAKMFESFWPVLDGLFIGDRDAAEDLTFFRENKVTRVINCCGTAVDNCFEAAGITYLTYRWSDDCTQIILDEDDEVMSDIFNFIEEAMDQLEGVLVQSFKGQSRACVIVTAYLMKKYRWSLRSALQYFSFRCPSINPNRSFLEQLKAYGQRLEDESNLPQKSALCKDDDSESEWDELVLQNTYVNCQQRLPLRDVQVSQHVTSASARQVAFANDLAEVTPYEIGSALANGSKHDEQDVENRNIVTGFKSCPDVLKSALKSASRNGLHSKGNAKNNGVAHGNAGHDSSNGHSITILCKSGESVSCQPSEIVPKRFGLQFESSTIVLEYDVPKCKIRAHHNIWVDLDSNLVRSLDADDEVCNRAIAQHLLGEHKLWLARTPSEQLARLVGRLRAHRKQRKPCARKSSDRTPGRSPR